MKVIEITIAPSPESLDAGSVMIINGVLLKVVDLVPRHATVLKVRRLNWLEVQLYRLNEITWKPLLKLQIWLGLK